MARPWLIRRALQCLVVLSAGCLPFFGGKGVAPRTPEAVQRFHASANALGLPPSPPPLADVTSLLAAAVEALPNAPGAHELSQQIDVHARAMQSDAADRNRRARLSIDLGVQALQKMRKPAGSKKAREHALQEVRQAVGVGDGYRALGRAFVLFTGGRPQLTPGSTLLALVSRFAVEDDELARRTGAQALYAVGEALRELHVDPGDLGQRAQRLVDAAPLEYAPGFRDALDQAVAALRKVKLKSDNAAFKSLADQAHEAVQRFARDRPFELQRPAAQDALRLIVDAITVAAQNGT